MADDQDVMIRKLEQHSRLSQAERTALRELPTAQRQVRPGEDLVRQGDRPEISLVVLKGMLARYHTLRGGGRQYLSFHIAGDWPDAQALFLERMDHAVCAVDTATVAMIPHRRLLALFTRMPSTGFVVWRETLIDAAIFREAITNNSKRPVAVRLAHFLCEQYHRAEAAGLTESDTCDLPLNQTQIADALASSLTTINRAMQRLRRMKYFEFGGGRLQMRNWKRLADYGEFDPAYLHIRGEE